MLKDHNVFICIFQQEKDIINASFLWMKIEQTNQNSQNKVYGIILAGLNVSVKLFIIPIFCKYWSFGLVLKIHFHVMLWWCIMPETEACHPVTNLSFQILIQRDKELWLCLRYGDLKGHTFTIDHRDQI